MFVKVNCLNLSQPTWSLYAVASWSWLDMWYAFCIFCPVKLLWLQLRPTRTWVWMNMEHYTKWRRWDCPKTRKAPSTPWAGLTMTLRFSSSHTKFTSTSCDSLCSRATRGSLASLSCHPLTTPSGWLAWGASSMTSKKSPQNCRFNPAFRSLLMLEKLWQESW